MHNFTAKNIINDKFWIVELNGTNVGTVKFHNAVYIYFNNDTKESVTYTQEEFKNQFKIVNTNRNKSVFAEVYGYTTNCEEVFNVRTEENTPVYTKTSTSKNYFAAGYYAIYFPSIKWSSAHCPRLKTLQSYPFIGPFKSEEDVNLAMKRKRYEETTNVTSGNIAISQ
jgi:hypothetical protein|tara:strand:- start:1163 stop:1666 length:504 start_codon:yes stop_codon:yes gene_type:complete